MCRRLEVVVRNETRHRKAELSTLSTRSELSLQQNIYVKKPHSRAVPAGNKVVPSALPIITHRNKMRCVVAIDVGGRLITMELQRLLQYGRGEGLLLQE